MDPNSNSCTMLQHWDDRCHANLLTTEAERRFTRKIAELNVKQFNSQRISWAQTIGAETTVKQLKLPSSDRFLVSKLEEQ